MVLNKSASQLKKGALYSYLAIFVNILSGLIYTPWMIRQIGQSQYGLFTLANSLISLFMVDFGLSSACARYVSNFHAEGREDKVEGVLGVIYKLYLIVDFFILLSLVIVFFFLDVIYLNLTPDELIQFKVVYSIAGIYSVVSFPFVTLNGILTAYEKFQKLKLSELLYRFLVICLMIFSLLMGWGLYALVTVNALAGMLTIVYKYIVVKKETSLKVNFNYSSKTLYKEIFKFSIWITVSLLAQRLIFNITPSILGIVANTSAIAIFGIVTTIESYTYLFANAINGMFMPKISNIYVNDKEGNVLPLMLSVGKFQYIVNGLIVVGFLILGKQFLLLWMGESYIDSYYCILLVIIPGLFYNALQIANTAMIVKNKVKYQALVDLVMGIINVVLSFALSSIFGVIGACISIFIAYSFRTVALLFVYKKTLSINMLDFIKECYIKLSICLIATIIFINLFLDNLGLGGWIGLVIKAIIITLIYFALIYILGLNKKEKKFIRSFIKKI